MTLTKKRLSLVPISRSFFACTLLITISGCSSMEMAKDQLDSYCAKRGEHPFVREAKQNGIPVVFDLGSAIVAVCYSDEDIVHFPDLGIDVIPLGEPNRDPGIGIVSVSSRSIADRAGLRAGDTIAEYAGQVTTQPADLRAAVDAAAIGQPVTVKFRRATRDLTATLQ